MKSLIVKAIEPNPRQVKRFVNNIILAKEVFGKEIDTLFGSCPSIKLPFWVEKVLRINMSKW